MRITGAPPSPSPLLAIHLCPHQIGEDSILTRSVLSSQRFLSSERLANDIHYKQIEDRVCEFT
jgi:hypothetical protein